MVLLSASFLRAYAYTHSKATLNFGQGHFILQCPGANIETHDWPKAGEQVTLECSALGQHFHCFLQNPKHGEYEKRNMSWKMGRSSQKLCCTCKLLASLGYLHKKPRPIYTLLLMMKAFVGSPPSKGLQTVN